MAAHTIANERCRNERKNTAYSVARIVIDLAAGKSMQPSGLSKEPTEKQNAQNHNDRDYDYFDQAHG